MGPVLYGGLSCKSASALSDVYVDILWSHCIVLVVWTCCSIFERIDWRSQRLLLFNIVQSGGNR